METVANITSAASKAIWGEPSAAGNETAGREPRNGVVGDVAAGEPYDKGNAGYTPVTAESSAVSPVNAETPLSAASPGDLPSTAAHTTGAAALPTATSTEPSSETAAQSATADDAEIAAKTNIEPLAPVGNAAVTKSEGPTAEGSTTETANPVAAKEVDTPRKSEAASSIADSDPGSAKKSEKKGKRLSMLKDKIKAKLSKN